MEHASVALLPEPGREEFASRRPELAKVVINQAEYLGIKDACSLLVGAGGLAQGNAHIVSAFDGKLFFLEVDYGQAVFALG